MQRAERKMVVPTKLRRQYTRKYLRLPSPCEKPRHAQKKKKNVAGCQKKWPRSDRDSESARLGLRLAGEGSESDAASAVRKAGRRARASAQALFDASFAPIGRPISTDMCGFWSSCAS